MKKKEVIFKSKVEKDLSVIDHSQRALQKTVSLVFELTAKTPNLAGIMGAYKVQGSKEDAFFDFVQR